METWAALDRWATRRHGTLDQATLRRAGVTYAAVSRHAARFAWRRLHRGVYALPGTARGGHQAASAALLAVGPGALLTGDVALWLYGILPDAPHRVDVVVPAERRPAPRAGVRIHRTRVHDALRPRTVDGLALVPPARALADAAAGRTADRLGRHIARSVALRLCTLDAARSELDARRRFPGRAAFRAAVELLAGGLDHSRDEATARRLVREAGLRPHPIVDADRVVAEADIAIVRLRYDVEVDGPHHDLPEQARADKARDRRLGRRGWTVDRFPVEMIREHPHAFVREVSERVRRLGG